eukprot:TRINITY_DN12256_c0_g2_i2.p1 TRINITY_DN12256_c0_g2~~TRINITY_DN12256_c0_g2_i2.p1  ORF type:complete len:148 (+),score=33.11 TRINITY_DN12256_c0_g2_i2:47-445(+)
MNEFWTPDNPTYQDIFKVFGRHRRLNLLLKYWRKYILQLMKHRGKEKRGGEVPTSKPSRYVAFLEALELCHINAVQARKLRMRVYKSSKISTKHKKNSWIMKKPHTQELLEELESFVTPANLRRTTLDLDEE